MLWPQTSSFELNYTELDVCELLEDITQLLALRWTDKAVEAVSYLQVCGCGCVDRCDIDVTCRCRSSPSRCHNLLAPPRL